MQSKDSPVLGQVFARRCTRDVAYCRPLGNPETRSRPSLTLPNKEEMPLTRAITSLLPITQQDRSYKLYPSIHRS